MTPVSEARRGGQPASQPASQTDRQTDSQPASQAQRMSSARFPARAGGERPAGKDDCFPCPLPLSSPPHTLSPSTHDTPRPTTPCHAGRVRAVGVRAARRVHRHLLGGARARRQELAHVLLRRGGPLGRPHHRPCHRVLHLQRLRPRPGARGGGLGCGGRAAAAPRRRGGALLASLSSLASFRSPRLIAARLLPPTYRSTNLLSLCATTPSMPRPTSTHVQDVADSCKTGAATDIIFGLALGYKSGEGARCCCGVMHRRLCCCCLLRRSLPAPVHPLTCFHLLLPCALCAPPAAIVPCIIIAIAIFTGFSLAHMYGIACAALGMLGTISTCEPSPPARLHRRRLRCTAATEPQCYCPLPRVCTSTAIAAATPHPAPRTPHPAPPAFGRRRPSHRCLRPHF